MTERSHPALSVGAQCRRGGQPQHPHLSVAGGAEQLALVIEDDGPGFPDAILADPGQPFQSDKDGAGRGLGLFLTGNVMRRLNGEMRLANLRHGAQVTLLLPTLETAA